MPRIFRAPETKQPDQLNRSGWPGTTRGFRQDAQGKKLVSRGEAHECTSVNATNVAEGRESNVILDRHSVNAVQKHSVD